MRFYKVTAFIRGERKEFFHPDIVEAYRVKNELLREGYTIEFEAFDT